ncbi:hypothetical protein ACQ4PT_009558 [Festuca glaucescens]
MSPGLYRGAVLGRMLIRAPFNPGTEILVRAPRSASHGRVHRGLGLLPGAAAHAKERPRRAPGQPGRVRRRREAGLVVFLRRAGSQDARARPRSPKVNGGQVGTGDGEHEPAVSSSLLLRGGAEDVLQPAARLEHAPRGHHHHLPRRREAVDAHRLEAQAADMLVDTFGFGRIIHDGFMFRQNFSIRSYEIGADRTTSIETLMNHLQETALNHVKGAGLLGDGFGSTPEMSKRNLFWVVSQMQAHRRALSVLG